jgi:ABC-type Zn2+ transport system substrate-binding protein/surface adhesin
MTRRPDPQDDTIPRLHHITIEISFHATMPPADAGIMAQAVAEKLAALLPSIRDARFINLAGTSITDLTQIDY